MTTRPPSPAPARRWLPWLLLAAIAGLYLALSLVHLDTPLLDPEETDLLWDHMVLSGAADESPRHVRASLNCIEAFGHAWPLSEDSHYSGAVELYLQQPLFWALGVSTPTLRLLPILFGLAVVLCTFALTRRWFGLTVAGWASALLATHPIFVHFTRQGHAAEEVFTVGFLWLCIYAWTRAREATGRSLHVAGWLGLAGLCFGLGLSQKVTFLWFVVGLASAALAVRWRPGLKGAGSWTALLGGALIGGSPLLLREIRSRGETARLLWRSLTTPLPKDGIDNLAYLHNLGVRGGQLWEAILRGEFWGPAGFKGELWGPQGYTLDLPGLLPLTAFAVLFLAALPVLVVTSRTRPPNERRVLLGLGILYAAVFLCTPFTVSAYLPNHLSVLYPFPQIAVGLLLGLLTRVPGPRWVRTGVPALLGALLLVANLRLTVHFYRMARLAGPAPTLEELMSYGAPWERGLPAPRPGSPPPGPHPLAPRR